MLSSATHRRSRLRYDARSTASGRSSATTGLASTGLVSTGLASTGLASTSDYAALFRLILCRSLLVAALGILACPARAQNAPQNPTNPNPTNPNPANPNPSPSPDAQIAAEAQRFRTDVQPVLRQYCERCHRADEQKSGVRVDQLTGEPEDRHFGLLEAIRSQMAEEAMPPSDEPQPTAAERQAVTSWIERVTLLAKTRQRAKNGSIRRLTVTQYRRTLRDLLHLEEDVTTSLPADGISKDGFTNHDKTLSLSPLLLESYFEIASRALDRTIVDENKKPTIQFFRMELGEGINREPCPDKLILGANSDLLNNRDFSVTQPALEKPFAFEPLRMRTKFDFIEGYAGNDTVRGWRHYDSIYHAVFACMRGTPGYPRGLAHEAVPEGLVLRPAIPSPEVFGRSNTYGPQANFKISLRELPDQGNFRVTVRAARYDDGLLLDAGVPGARTERSMVVPLKAATGASSPPFSNLPATARVGVATLNSAGIYQVDVGLAAGAAQNPLHLRLGNRSFTSALAEPKAGEVAPYLIVRLAAGELPVIAQLGDGSRLQELSLTQLADDHPQAKRFLQFERREPLLGVHLGLRRDCGSTLARVGTARPVAAGELRGYEFFGAINDYPSPDVEVDNVNYLAGVREIGVRSEYTDGRDMPRLLIRSIDFEGPFYEQWPPLGHRSIFIDSPRRDDPAAYASDILRSFATRAFRRPVSESQLKMLTEVWRQSFDQQHDFRAAIKDALLVVLTAPQFLFLIETSQGPEAEPIDDWELAAKLSYFLWNGPPDERLLSLAATGKLRSNLAAESDRLISDARSAAFFEEFTRQWLQLDKFDVVAVDTERFPRLKRDVKAELRREPIELLTYLIRGDRSLRELVAANYVIANEVVADYYGLGERAEHGFQFGPVVHDQPHLGGVLTQASILAGLSDGRESNPIKRGAWLARKIIAQPPADPPPNVPRLPEGDQSKLSLREKLQQHREQPGCAKCHQGIDPWGLPLERFNAAGLLKGDAERSDTRSQLPTGRDVADVVELKQYLVGEYMPEVAFSYLKHLACYAVGRTLTYNELVSLRSRAVEFQQTDYPSRAMLRAIIESDLFLQK